MPAFEDEIVEALEEGVKIRYLVNPIRIGQKDGLKRIECLRMELSEKDESGRRRPVPIPNSNLFIDADHVIIAAGEEIEASFLPEGLEKKEVIIQHLIGEGPSLSIFGYLHPGERLRNPHVVTFEELNMDYFEPAKRQGESKGAVKERIKGFKEVSSALSEGVALEEAERCFSCGTCNECENCYVFCPDGSVLKREELFPHQVDYDYCKGWGICFTECPRGAISLKEEAKRRGSSQET